MKNRIIILISLSLACITMWAQDAQPKKQNFVMRSTTFGVGASNIYDTYLTPVEYKGIEFRITSESMRMTRMLRGNVSGQSLLNVNFSLTENDSETGNMYYGMANWSYALHYQFKLSKNLKILTGPFLDLNAGFIYNVRNSNNPAQAKAYGGLGASGMAIYNFKIARYPMKLRYQVDIPLAGLAFSPQYGQSYYEIFELGHRDHNVVFTSIHNAPSLRQMLTLDFPVGNVILRAGYLCDIRQFKVNHLRSHAYSNNFMIGFVRNIYRIKGKKRISMPNHVTPF